MKTVLLIGLFLTSFFAHAGWTQWGKVEEIMSHDGIHIIYTSITDETCGQNGNFWWPKEDPDSEDMMAIALAAMMSGRNVRLLYDPLAQECQFGHIAKARMMRIR